MSFLGELFLFVRERKNYWLVPVLVMMLVFGTLLILVQNSAVAPFIYTIF